jgi:predicted O-methyltransferase YrrM
VVTKSDLKILLRSGSYKFMRDLHAEESEEVFQYKGHPVYYRAGSSDMYLIYMILIKEGAKAEYWLPEEFKPKVILDIGANIGITSLYYANKYPEAKIYSFEPVPVNYELLEKNLKEYENVKTFNVALGAQDGELDIFVSDFKDN